MFLHPCAKTTEAGHDRIGIRKQVVLQTQRVEFLHPLCHGRVRKGAHRWLGERTIEAKIGLRYSSGGREAAIIRRVIAPEFADIFECPDLAAHHPVAGYEIRIFGVLDLAIKYSLVETG